RSRARSHPSPRRLRTLTTERVPGPILEDIPEAEVVLSDRARPALEALAAEAGLTVEGSRRTQVVYRPGRSLVVTHDCRLDGPGGRLRRSIVLGAGPRAPSGGATVEGGGYEVQGWVYPHDPALPGLAMWFDAGSRSSLLAGTGLGAPDVLRARSYRPGRRAVLELVFSDRSVFVKAVRPKTVADLQARHRLLSATLPVPRSLGWLPDHGVVVMDGMAGETLATAGIAPSVAGLEALLDAIPATEYRVTPLRNRAAGHARRLRAILPGSADRVSEIEGRLAAIEPGPAVAAHGDLHAGQLIVRDGVVAGLIDVDTVGMGERLDDIATLIAHLHVSALAGRPDLARMAEQFLAGFEARVDPAMLRPRIAAGVFGHAAGPWTRQQPDWELGVAARLDAAEAWLG
ncbi:MAG: phosphotransferase, partial [Acidimicrobiia bacterium]